MKKSIKYQFFKSNMGQIIQDLGKDLILEDLKRMLLIRNFEIRAESCYMQGKIGGFFHSYVGQEAVQTACIRAVGAKHWFTTTYRCHALALLLGATPNEIMAELFGKENGNAKGRGGSMHLYTERMLGGFAIVGGHIPVATGAAFSIKYLEQSDLISLCFLGDGAVAQGAFHEALNLASLWSLPCMYVIENNQWGMGTAVDRAICTQPIAENVAPGYQMKSYTLDGTDYFNCFEGFKKIYEEIIQTQRPALVEVIVERFKGHSISDPAFYRTKEELEAAKQKDPLQLMKNALIKEKLLTEEDFKNLEKQAIDIAKESIQFAEKSPDCNPLSLGEGVFAPEDEGS